MVVVTERADMEPVPDFRFAVEIEGIAVGWFTECSGLSMERETYPYKEGGLNAYVHELPGRVKRTHITLKRGVADEELWKWFAGKSDEGLHEGKVTHRNTTVILYNVDRTEARRWNINRAYPVKWAASDLVSDSNEVAVETLELAQEESSGSGGVQRTAATGSQRGIGEGVEQAIEQSDTTASAAEPDLPALAEAVYALLKYEARVEQERQGWGER